MLIQLYSLIQKKAFKNLSLQLIDSVRLKAIQEIQAKEDALVWAEIDKICSEVDILGKKYYNLGQTLSEIGGASKLKDGDVLLIKFSNKRKDEYLLIEAIKNTRFYFSKFEANTDGAASVRFLYKNDCPLYNLDVTNAGYTYYLMKQKS